MLVNLYFILKDFLPQKQKALHQFLQVEYLHKLRLAPDRLRYVQELARRLFELKNPDLQNLEEEIGGHALFQKNIIHSCKALNSLLGEFSFWEDYKNGAVCQLGQLKLIQDVPQALKANQKLESALKAKTQKEETDHTCLGELAEHFYFYSSDKANAYSKLERAHFHYTQTYLIRALRLQLEMKANRRIYNGGKHESKPPVLGFTTEEIETHSAQNPTIHVYQLLLPLDTDTPLSAFENCIDQFFIHFDHIPDQDASLIGNHVINLINSVYECTGEFQLQQQMFKLYHFFWSQHKVFADYFKHPRFFTNALSVAAHVKQSDWAYLVLEAMRPYFEARDKDTLDLGLAKIAQFSGDYDLAEKALKDFSTRAKDRLLVIDLHKTAGILYLNHLYLFVESLKKETPLSKTQMQQVQKKRESLIHKLNSFYVALNREMELNPDRAQSYYNYIAVLRAIQQFLVTGNQTPEKAIQLLQKVEAMTPLAAKGSLLEFIKTKLLLMNTSSTES